LVWINSSSGVLHWLLSILALASCSLAISMSLRSFYRLAVMILRMLMQFWVWMTDTLSNLVFQLHISLVLFLFLMLNLFLVLLDSSLICQVSKSIPAQSLIFHFAKGSLQLLMAIRSKRLYCDSWLSNWSSWHLDLRPERW
jgi:hypothetical protein